MPWTLIYPNNLDGRITRNGHRASFQASNDVESIDVRAHPGTSLVVHFRNEDVQTDSPALRRIFDQYGQLEPRPYDEIHTPFTHRPMEGFRLLPPLPQQPNQNGDTIDPEARQRIVEEYIRSSEGRARLGQAMIAPLRRNIDYQAVGRRTFLVEQLPEGALPVYDRDPEIGTMVMMHANSNLPPPPNFERPAWLVVGQWVHNVEQQRFACITQATKLRVQWAEWRTGQHTAENVVTFVHHWKPCAKPAEPRRAWERLLDDEDF